MTRTDSRGNVIEPKPRGMRLLRRFFSKPAVRPPADDATTPLGGVAALPAVGPPAAHGPGAGAPSQLPPSPGTGVKCEGCGDPATHHLKVYGRKYKICLNCLNTVIKELVGPVEIIRMGYEKNMFVRWARDLGFWVKLTS